jgi:hypothetical protein
MSTISGAISTPNPAIASQQSQAAKPFPVNRVVTALSPVIAIIAGGIASWLGTKFPGLNLNTGQASTEIAQGIMFASVALGTVAIHYKWLDGWQKWESAVAPVVGPAMQVVESLDPGATRVNSPLTAQAVSKGINQ